MDYPWIIYRFSIVYQKFIHSLSIDYLGIIHGLSMSYPYNVIDLATLWSCIVLIIAPNMSQSVSKSIQNQVKINSKCLKINSKFLKMTF